MPSKKEELGAALNKRINKSIGAFDKLNRKKTSNEELLKPIEGTSLNTSMGTIDVDIADTKLNNVNDMDMKQIKITDIIHTTGTGTSDNIDKISENTLNSQIEKQAYKALAEATALDPAVSENKDEVTSLYSIEDTDNIHTAKTDNIKTKDTGIDYANIKDTMPDPIKGADIEHITTTDNIQDKSTETDNTNIKATLPNYIKVTNTNHITGTGILNINNEIKPHVNMVKKIIHIKFDQNEAIKELAAQYGVAESQIIRQLIDFALTKTKK